VWLASLNKHRKSATEDRRIQALAGEDRENIAVRMQSVAYANKAMVYLDLNQPVKSKRRWMDNSRLCSNGDEGSRTLAWLCLQLVSNLFTKSVTPVKSLPASAIISSLAFILAGLRLMLNLESFTKAISFERRSQHCSNATLATSAGLKTLFDCKPLWS
jgi:hypothetical protein